MSKRKPGVLFHIRIPVTVLGIILLLGLTLIAMYRFLPQSRAGIVFVGAVVAASATIYVAFFTAYNVRRGIESLEQSNQDRRVSTAFTFIERWNHTTFREVRNEAWRIKDELKNTPQEQIWKILDEDEDKRSKILEVLNFFEEMELSIRLNGADEDVIRGFFRFVALEMYNSSDKFIKHYRNKHNTPRVFIEYENLYKRWNEPA